MKVLSDAQFDAEFEDNLCRGRAKDITVHNDREEINLYSCPYISDGCDRVIYLRPGFWLRLWSFTPLDDLKITDDDCNDDEISISFFVTGSMRTSLPGVIGEVDEATGSSYIMHCPGVIETESWQANRPILRVKIVIDPVEFFNTINTNQIDSLPQALRQFATQDSVEPFYLQGTITTEIQTIVQQILDCPFQGAIKQWYFESKALELLSLQVHQFQAENRYRQFSLPAKDIEKIHRAKDILVSNIAEPPSIIELAETVDIYHMKLKQGFREVFSFTPFAYLRDYRLERARMLLGEPENTITAIANQVGYSNPGHFAAAFRRKFGMTPRQYRP